MFLRSVLREGKGFIFFYILSLYITEYDFHM